MADDESTKDPLKRVQRQLQKHTTEAQQRRDIKAAETPVQLFLPGFEDALRAMPNQISRSSLFAPVARGRKKFHVKTVLVSRSDATLTYTGTQLDETQADIWMQLVYEAKGYALGVPVTINRAAFLRAVGRAKNGKAYAWLHQAMYDFTVATMLIEARKPDGAPKYSIGHTRAFHMLSYFDYDAKAEAYTFIIDPRWKALFDGKEYALIEWDKRLEIGRGLDMAKALQRLVHTSADPVQRYALDWLKEKMQYAGRLRDFKDALEAAMRELVRLGIIAGGHIEDSTRGKEQAVLSRCAASPVVQGGEG